MSELDVITMKLIEDKLNIPLDVVIYMNKFVKYQEILN